jgi:hypothetical protein
MTARPRKPLLVNLTWGAVLMFVFVPVLYVLSYAPFACWWSRDRPIMYAGPSWAFGTVYPDGDELPLYRPADWLIDRTPIQKPLFWWAGLFGMREEFEEASAFRESARTP